MCSPPVAPEENDGNNEEAEEIVEGWHTINMHLRHLRQRAARDGQIATHYWPFGTHDFTGTPMLPLQFTRAHHQALQWLIIIDTTLPSQVADFERINPTFGTFNRGVRNEQPPSQEANLPDLDDLPDLCLDGSCRECQGQLPL